MNFMSYITITLLIIGIIIFTVKAYNIYRFGLHKTYTLSGRQILLQYILLILLALSIVSRHWEKLTQS